GTRKLTSTALRASCCADSARTSRGIVGLARPQHPPIRSAEQQMQERKNPRDSLASRGKPEAVGSGGDEICAFKLLEAPHDHGFGSIERGDLSGFEWMCRELRQ